jgi:hypothetical protein
MFPAIAGRRSGDDSAPAFLLAVGWSGEPPLRCGHRRSGPGVQEFLVNIQ